MPVTTRSGKSYDLTAAAERQNHSRTRMSENQVHARWREYTASRRARRTSEARTTEQSENTTRRRVTRAQRISDARATERRTNTASRREARARQSSEIRAN